MKKLTLTLVFTLIQITTFAQAPAIDWQRCYGGTASEGTNCIQPTSDGGYILVSTSKSNDGDVNGNNGGWDIWVVKISASGSLVWQKSLGGTGDDFANAIQLTTDGGYIIAGYTGSNNGNVTNNHGGFDAWIIKLSASGSLVWQKSIGGSNDDFANSIIITPDGGYLMAGSTASNNGDVTGNHGNKDAWIVKLSASGGFLWQKAMGGGSDDYANNIQPTPDGGFIMAGFTGSIGGDVSSNHGNNDSWIVKLSSLGALVWQKSFGGTNDDYAFSIQPTLEGGYIFAGFTFSTDGEITGNYGNIDAWVVKLSSLGDLEWQKNIGGSNFDFIYCIQLTIDGGYIVVGYSNSVDFDVLGNHGNHDYWAVKLSDSGTIIWQKTIGGIGDDQANNIQVTNDGGYIISGQTFSTDGDVTGNHGGGDAWVVKLGPDLSTTTFEKESVEVYPNPATTMLNIKNNNETPFEKITIIDLMGKIVLSQTNTNQVNIAPLASGLYIIEAVSGTKKLMAKFVRD